MYNHTHSSLIEQTINNATSWIGHRNYDDKDVAAGQTFLATAEADLETIEIYPTLVTRAGRLMMTVFDFDEQNNRWGASLGSSQVEITKDSNDHWVPFHLKGLHLTKGKTYGFKLESADTYIGVGEAASSANNPPMHAGKEWKFVNNEQQVHDGFRYFSLAFKVGVKAA